MKDFQDLYNGGSTSKLGWSGEDGQHSYKVYKHRRDFPYFDGEDVHK